MDINLRLMYAVCAVVMCLVNIPGQTDSSEECVHQFSEDMMSEFQEVRVNLSILTQQLSSLTLHLTTGTQDLIEKEKRKRVKATQRLNEVIDAERRQNTKLSEQLDHCLNSNESCDGCSQPSTHVDESTTAFMISDPTTLGDQPTTAVDQPHCQPPTGSGRWLAGGHKTNKTFRDIMTRVMGVSKTDMYEVGASEGYRLFVVNDMLWAPNWYSNIILVLDPHTHNTPTQIMTPRISPRSVYQTSPTEVLLAADHGLYVLSTTGSVLYKVAGGFITDLSVDCDTATAYVYNQTSQHVVTVTHNGSRWVRTGSFGTGQSSRDKFITIELVGGTIYLGSRFAHNIQTYTLTGSHLDIHGYEGRRSPGQLDGPYLSGTDSQGALLVSDRWNHRLQVLSPGGGWEVYILGGVRYPQDVTVDTSGNLWVLWGWGASAKVSKYSV